MSKKKEVPVRKPVVVSEKHISFSPDSGLMYCIQQTTNEATEDILGFFFDFGREVLNEGITNISGSSIRKDIRDYYPGTSIPFKLLVKGQESYYHARSNAKAEDKYRGSIEVSFPDTYSYINTQEMIDIIMEKQLLGGSSLPPFEPPQVKTPKMYKDLIEKVLRKGKTDETIQRGGHTRETGSSEETVE